MRMSTYLLSRRLAIYMLSMRLSTYLPLNCFSANFWRIGRSILFFNLSYRVTLITGKTAPSSFAYNIHPPSYTFKTYKTHRFNSFQKIQWDKTPGDIYGAGSSETPLTVLVIVSADVNMVFERRGGAKRTKCWARKSASLKGFSDGLTRNKSQICFYTTLTW